MALLQPLARTRRALRGIRWLLPLRRRGYMECLDYMWWMPVRFRFCRLAISSPHTDYACGNDRGCEHQEFRVPVMAILRIIRNASNNSHNPYVCKQYTQLSVIITCAVLLCTDDMICQCFIIYVRSDCLKTPKC